MQQRVYECRINSVDELKQRLIEVWNSLQQNVIDASINDCRKQLRAYVHEDGQDFEHLLQARVTNKVTVKLETVSIVKPLQNRQHAQNPYFLSTVMPQYNIGGALCSTPKSLADAHYWSAVQ